MPDGMFQCYSQPGSFVILGSKEQPEALFPVFPSFFLKKNFMIPFYEWGLTASRLQGY